MPDIRLIILFPAHSSQLSIPKTPSEAIARARDTVGGHGNEREAREFIATCSRTGSPIGRTREGATQAHTLWVDEEPKRLTTSGRPRVAVVQAAYLRDGDDGAAARRLDL